MSTDEILDDLIQAQSRYKDAADEATHRRDARDAALVRARKTGTGPTELARLTGLSRVRVNQLLTKYGLLGQ